MDKTIDDATDGKSKTKTKTEDGEVKVKQDGDETKIKTEGNVKSGSSLSFNSKYDFVPGEKVIAFEDFSTAEIGDFPTRWNTNATAEVVTINSREGKWLKINKEGVFLPEFITNLPDNFTFEFDLAVNQNWRGTIFAANIIKLDNATEYTNYYHNIHAARNHYVHFQLKPGTAGTQAKAYSRLQAGKPGEMNLNNDVSFGNWDNGDKNFVHISMWRQGQRLRVYANGEKIWDVPRAFDAGSTYNAMTFGMDDSYAEEDYMLLGNIRLASGIPDTRNKLMTEGKFVTRGILFDVNSDRIKPESSGALRDIANVLKENSSVKVKIIGHTDSDGDDKTNLDLSKRRAAAVKAILVKEYGISGDNLETDGKGESEPADKNTSS